MFYGYCGKILKVNLSSGRIIQEELTESLARNYLGAKGFGTKILYDEVQPGIDPLGKENKIIFATGPLTGTKAFSPKMNITTKSPLTNGYLDGTVGGFLGAELKFAGYDIVIIEGKSEKPTYLHIHDGEVRLREAGHLWRKGTHDTERMIKDELKDKKIRVASIGEAGENLVRFACISVDLGRQVGRGGAGAVMGSKNLKAIAVKGSKEVNLHNAESFPRNSKAYYKELKGKGGHLRKEGLMFLMDPINEFGILPTRNFKEGVFSGIDRVNAKFFIENFKPKNKGCFSCVPLCGKYCDIESEEFGRFQIEGPEYETAALLGPNCGIDNFEAIAYANYLCDDYGMDTMSAGGTIAFTIECFEKGLLTPEDTDDLELRWGNYKSILELIRKISLREGIGNLLAEGTKRMSKTIGRGSEAFAIHVKGLELPAYDPRGAIGMGLNYAVADRGACHLRAFTVSEELFKGMQPYSIEKKASLVKYRMHKKIIQDSLGTCELLGFDPMLGKLLTDATGWNVYPSYNPIFNTLEDFRYSEDDCGIGERIYNLARAFNVRNGFGKGDDILPERFFVETMTEGKVKGKLIDRADFEKMLSEYYEISGWTAEGVPTREKLLELNLIDVAKAIYG
jgi:aldehyde:ferredoxin oxidoreductase